MRTLLAAILPLSLLSAACGGAGSPTASSHTEPASRAEVDRREIVLAAPGDTASVGVTASGQATRTPELSLAAERRWLHDAPVLDAAALAAGRIVAAAPGTAELDARAFGAAPARVTVHVRPGRPLLLRATPLGDTVVLRGYRAGDAAAVAVGGTTATRIGGDSATLRVLLPPRTDASCARAAAEPVTAQGAEVAAGMAVARRHADELRLAVGAPVRLTAAQAACMRLAAVPGAAYALAFVDARRVRQAATAFEGAAPNPAQYSVTVAEAGSIAPSAALLAPSAARFDQAPDHVRRNVSASSGTAAARAEPWREGERFELRDVSLAAPLPVRVMRVYAGHLVLAVAEGEEPAGGTEAWIARADSAFRLLTEHGYPLYRAALSPSMPSTSAGAGQLLVVARRETSAYLGSTATSVVGGQASSLVFLNSAYPATASGLLKTLGHEVAHAWQERWAQDRRGEAAAGTGAAGWAAEAGAELMSAAIAGRAAGIGMRSNWEWSAHLGDPALAPYAGLAAGARGDLTAGYASGASFLLDLAGRMVARGSGEAEALAEVSAGVLEGWNGFARTGPRARGLTERMRARLGEGWEPVDALLLWTLSQGVDDLTPNAELQNRAFARAGTAGESAGAGWLAAARLASGGRAARVDPAAASSVAGNAATVTARYGSPGYVLIDDDSAGGAYTLGATWNGAPLRDVEWMVVRYR